MSNGRVGVVQFFYIRRFSKKFPYAAKNKGGGGGSRSK